MMTNSSSGDSRLSGNGTAKLIVSTQDGNKSDVIEVTVALSTYTLVYNANGGSGAPSDRLTKTRYIPVWLSSARPTRAGYTFLGWSTSANGSGTLYSPGSKFNESGSSSGGTITLYAVWKPAEYTVSYNANGGSGAPGNQRKYQEVPLKLSTTFPERVG